MIAPKVSVIMPTYNHGPFVAEAIDSVLSQQGVEFEFLIADDGSSDNTRDVVASFKDKRIRFAPNEVNQGACTVTNQLISRARGEYIALINSDDAWKKDKLRLQVDVLDSDPRLGASFGRANFFDRDGHIIAKQALPFGKVFDQPNRSSAEWLRHFFAYGNCLCHPTMLIRRCCYDELGLYNNRMRQLPDFDMWVRLVKRFELHVTDQDLINFRILPGENASSQTTVNSIRTMNEHFLIAESFFSGVSRAHLMKGFHDLLRVKHIPSDEHLDIEKALLYFHHNQWLGKPYKMVGLLRLSHLLASPEHEKVLKESYGIDDRWFHQEMGSVDVLQPRMLAATKSAVRGLMGRFATLWSR